LREVHSEPVLLSWLEVYESVSLHRDDHIVSHAYEDPAKFGAIPRRLSLVGLKALPFLSLKSCLESGNFRVVSDRKCGPEHL
jgi:hypothetical protein